MVDYAYLIRDLVRDIIEARLAALEVPASQNSFHFYPGKWADKEQGQVEQNTGDFYFGTYRLHQRVEFDQPYIHNDSLTMTLYSPRFDHMQRAVSDIVTKMNFESIYENEELMKRVYGHDGYEPYLNDPDNDEHVKPLELILRVMYTGDNEYVNQQEYFTAGIDIFFHYVTYEPDPV
jgi:hypothetical protein